MSGRSDALAPVSARQASGAARVARPGAMAGLTDRGFGWIAVTPTVVTSLLVFGLPLAFSLFVSFQGWSIQQSLFGGRFVGFDNYFDLFDDPAFVASISRTFLYTGVTVTAELFCGLGLAMLLNVDLKFIGFFRTALIVPMMMTPIVAALCWKMLLDPQYGIIDYLIGQPIVWLGHPVLAFVSVAGVNIWQNAPYVAILLLAGLRSLPSEPVEAAAIDGASGWQVFVHVTLPLLKPYIIVALLLRVIFEFRSFDNVYVMTSGGPADATSLLSIYTYVTSFVSFDMSLAAASSWVMLAFALVFCLAFVVIVRRRDAT